jgi:DNA-binding response OmpR family regulator
MSQVNILVAEDFAGFREVARRELERGEAFHVVTVSDGLAAVQTAEELRPDLILLDIGLPALNGFAAAQRIHGFWPESRIVFWSQGSSADVVHRALNLGSRGHIDKRCVRYLLPAVEAILDRAASRSGERRLSDDDPGGRPHGHHVQFYSDDSVLLERAEHALASALAARDAAVVLATAPHRRVLIDRLRKCGVDVDRAIGRGTFRSLDADEMVARILSHGVTNCTPLLRDTLESAATATLRADARVTVVGECASRLWASGHVDAAIGLEQVGDDLCRILPVDIMCTYPLDPRSREDAFKTLCAQHAALAIR